MRRAVAGPGGGRGFTFLWLSQALSEAAYSTSLIVLPLLVLTITGSPSRAGIIGFVDAAAMLLAGLPAGAVADRYDRRRVLLCCEAVLVTLFGGLALLLWAGRASLPALVLLALVNGAATAVMLAASEAMVPTLVPEERLASAVAMNSARTYAGQLAGTSAGGFLLAVRNALPFLAGCAAHLASLVLLLFLRPQAPAGRAGQPDRSGPLDESGQTEQATVPAGGGRRELVEGIRWVRRHPFLRLSLCYATATNFFFGAIYFMVIASAKTSGMSPGLIGVMAGLLGVGGLLGALASPLLQRVLAGPRSIFVVLWLFAVLTAGIAVLPGSWTPGVLLGAIAFAAPTANAYLTTHQLLLTPDSHRGRVMSVAGIASGAGGAIAPLAGGTVLDLTGRFAGLLGCAAVMAAIALSAVLSPVMRKAPEPAREAEPGCRTPV
ncbi:MFS transporter [Kitasatospora kifunensis]|uniref:MFS family permease n=1 Tax=Kitasatospora kifunensis TaxID=58351 RepID=A0A7W7VZL1_KITKI|nr:MFS transporter [Kitasatospora kifunensis]MBB4927839.1 MFS family permease [Kitasatospora kifunensis]